MPATRDFLGILKTKYRYLTLADLCQLRWVLIMFVMQMTSPLLQFVVTLRSAPVVVGSIPTPSTV